MTVARPRTLVLGLGNPILGDDAVGLKVAALVSERLGPASPVEVDEEYAGGLRLMERLAGYEKVVLVDALTSGTVPVGTVLLLGPADLPTRHAGSSHDVDLPTALRLGAEMGLPMPREISIVGVEADNVLDFCDDCTAAVAASFPEAAAAVLSELEKTTEAR